MELLIINKFNLDTDDLIEFLIKKIRLYIEDNLDYKELSRWDKYLKEANINWGTLGKKKRIPSARDIILGSSRNIIYDKYNDKYIISIDKNEYIPNTNIKYISIINLINYGNLSIYGYDIMDKAFSNISDKFNVYIEEYRRGI